MVAGYFSGEKVLKSTDEKLSWICHFRINCKLAVTFKQQHNALVEHKIEPT